MSRIVKVSRARAGDPVGLLESLISEVHLGETDSVFVIAMRGNEWTFNFEGDCHVSRLVGYLEYAKTELLKRMH